MTDTEKKEPVCHKQRDGETLIALGIFMVVLSAPVLLGTFFEDVGFSMVVNVVAGVTLLAIGLGFLFRGKSTLKNQ